MSLSSAITLIFMEDFEAAQSRGLLFVSFAAWLATEDVVKIARPMHDADNFDPSFPLSVEHQVLPESSD